MKQKKKSKKKVAEKEKVLTPELPQNILPMGERVLENKNIYIHQKVYAKIHKFAANKTENEHGGILVGRVVNEMGKENTIIEGFIEAKYNTATPTTLTFTHETWEYFHDELDKRFKGQKIVGWIHTHPNFGIFLSENDRFIQQNFFTDANQVAYVIDPIQKDEGFFFWIDEKLERCPGFYLFDKNGKNLKKRADDIYEEEKDSGGTSITTYILLIVMALLLILNLFITLGQANKISLLEKEIINIEKVLINYGMISPYGQGYGYPIGPQVSVDPSTDAVQNPSAPETTPDAADPGVDNAGPVVQN